MVLGARDLASLQGVQDLGGPTRVPVVEHRIVRVGEVAGGPLPLEVLERVQEEGPFVFELGPCHGARTASEARGRVPDRCASARWTRARSSSETDPEERCRRRRHSTVTSAATDSANPTGGSTHTHAVHPRAGGRRRMPGPYRLTRKASI